MKKNAFLTKTLAGTMATLLIISGLTGCGAAKASDATKEELTITFMNQDQTLGTATAYVDELLDKASYEAFEQVEDAEFNGWFETPSFLESSKKDLSTDTFEKDTTLYGDFRSNTVAEDTRHWYIAGTSTKGALKLNNWAGSLSDEEKASFELTPTGNNVNEFSLTIDLFEGDQFQVIHDWKWDGQKGYGKFTDIDESQMENAGGLGGTADTSNVQVLVDGNYTITLTTNPDNQAQDTLSIVRNSDPLTDGEETEEEPFEVTENTKVFVKGSWVADWSELKELERKDGADTYTIEMELKADTELCFSVFEGEEDTGLVLKEENVTAGMDLLTENGNNVKISADGTYTFTVNLDDMTVEIAK
ncbi:hypothetical protein [Butyrivibrio sp. VCB2006]|uniref:hypothetical protein n=1 Tax=Butyrivibrio sp. VCB2006 TaxID=1280679 RepID=UPI000417B872|nr:hypothetical protein [Butyrivibrio sp. VCB2006]